MLCRIPFLVECTRPFRETESFAIMDRTSSLGAFVRDNMVFDDQGARRMPCFKVDKDLIPRYPLLCVDPVFELVPRDSILQTLYYVGDHTRPVPGNRRICDEDTNKLTRILRSVDPRTNLLKVNYFCRHNSGRYYADDDRNDLVPRVGSRVGSILSASKALRGGILRNSHYVDIDMVKSHASILASIAELMQVECPNLLYYIGHVDNVLQEIVDFYSADDENKVPVADAKTLMTLMLYGGGVSTWLDERHMGSPHIVNPAPLKNNDGHLAPGIFTLIKEEIRELAGVIASANHHLLPDPFQPTSHEQVMKILAQFCGTLECFLTYTALEYCVSVGAVRTVHSGGLQFIWGYDGFTWVPTRDADIDALLVGIQSAIVDKCGQCFRFVRFIRKPIDIFIPTVCDLTHELWRSNEFRNFDSDATLGAVSLTEDLMVDRLWPEAKIWFERDRFKIVRGNKYGREFINKQGLLEKVEWMSADDLHGSHSNYNFLEPNPKTGVMEEKQITQCWIRKRNMRLYEYADTYPPPLVAPAGIYNLWTESPHHGVGLRLGDSEDPQHLSNFLDLLAVVCGVGDRSDPNDLHIHCMEYMIFWLCQAIQVPAHKLGVIPVLTGTEGTGKTLFCSFVGALFGRSRTLECSCRNITDHFNNLLDGKYMVIINEVPTTMSPEQEGNFKKIVTDPVVVVNGKNKQEYEMKSFHRFICTTNDITICLPSERRPFWLGSTIDLKGNDEKLKILYAMLQDDKAIQSVYRYLAAVDIVARFGSLNLTPPSNERNQCMREKRNIYVQFARDLLHNTLSALPGNAVQLTRDELYNYFVDFLARNKETATTHTPKSFESIFLFQLSWLPNTFGAAVQGAGRIWNKQLMASTLTRM